MSSRAFKPNSNGYLLAKFGFDKAENEPIKASKTEKENTLET